MKRVTRQQRNYRLSPGIIRVLRETALATGLSQTQVLEVCVARHAVSLPALCARAQQEILEIVAAHLGQNSSKQKVTPGRVGAPGAASKGGIHGPKSHKGKRSVNKR
jgi:hypothetical protein